MTCQQDSQGPQSTLTQRISRSPWLGPIAIRAREGGGPCPSSGKVPLLHPHQTRPEARACSRRPSSHLAGDLPPPTPTLTTALTTPYCQGHVPTHGLWRCLPLHSPSVCCCTLSARSVRWEGRLGTDVHEGAHKGTRSPRAPASAPLPMYTLSHFRAFFTSSSLLKSTKTYPEGDKDKGN